ncbi:MFS transporter [Candidatus Endomicrobiellum pyrsonymphae]|uniref:MFS transporter n=1 Tax=Candidatus Endomicrobiellum pyrsonymphae TaxID=1408203 RepID=UPI0035A8455B
MVRNAGLCRNPLSGILFCRALYLHESLRWLVSKGKEKNAVEILNFLRNQGTVAEIAQEFSEIKNANDKERGSLKELMQKWVRIRIGHRRGSCRVATINRY